MSEITDDLRRELFAAENEFTFQVSQLLTARDELDRQKAIVTKLQQQVDDAGKAFAERLIPLGIRDIKCAVRADRGLIKVQLMIPSTTNVLQWWRDNPTLSEALARVKTTPAAE